MNDQIPSTDPQPNPPPENRDWREIRREERANRRAENRGLRRTGRAGWIAGLVLIGIGAVVLYQNLTGIRLFNWWALFILIPAVGAFGAAWNLYQSDGRLSGRGRSSLIGGFTLTIIAAAFLFNWDLGNTWPIFLILVGVAVLVNALLPG